MLWSPWQPFLCLMLYKTTFKQQWIWIYDVDEDNRVSFIAEVQANICSYELRFQKIVACVGCFQCLDFKCFSLAWYPLLPAAAESCATAWQAAGLTQGLNIAVKHFFQVCFLINVFTSLETSYVSLNVGDKMTLLIFVRSVKLVKHSWQWARSVCFCKMCALLCLLKGVHVFLLCLPYVPYVHRIHAQTLSPSAVDSDVTNIWRERRQNK